MRDYKIKVYRVGGDEFNAIVFNANEEGVKRVISKMRENITNAGYSASFGYQMNDKKYSVDELIKLADAFMYEEKKEYYNTHKRSVFSED